MKPMVPNTLMRGNTLTTSLSRSLSTLYDTEFDRAIVGMKNIVLSIYGTKRSAKVTSAPLLIPV